jgi:hypothetical protein
MPLTSTDQSIVAQVAAKIASDLAIASADVRIEDVVNDFAYALDAVATKLFDTINVAIAESALPGSVPVAGPPAAAPAAVPPAAAAPAPAAAPPAAAPAAAPAAGPAAVPATTADATLDGYWRDLFEHPENWYDNRNDPKRPRGAPDFKHKSLKSGKYNVGLYVDDKKNPDWVKAHFGV